MVTTSQQDQDQEDGGVVNEESDEQLVEFEFDCDDKGNKVMRMRYEHNIHVYTVCVLQLWIIHCLCYTVDGSW